MPDEEAQIDFLQLYHNRPLDELDGNTDLIGLLPKATAIKDIILNLSNNNDIRMIALYGNWGSGKTTLMHHLKKELNDNYETIFFDTWQLEKDNNLELSLLEKIFESQESNNKVKGALESGRKLFISFLKNSIYNIQLPNYNVGQALKDTTEELSTPYESFYSIVQDFKDKFQNAENLFDKKIIVFIDDIDRCEPENIINLLSSIKLFFTLGRKTIYLCGIDKKAVGKAIQTKHQDIIKSEEYLEKIFDLSFNMPESYDLDKLINNFFEARSPNFYKELNLFFNIIDLKNPRHLKKVLNKYNLLRWYKKHYLAYSDLIPDIANEENAITVIFVLYIITLYEFYNDKFQEIYFYQEKMINYGDGYIPYHVGSNPLDEKYSARENLKGIIEHVQNLSISYNTFNSNIKDITQDGGSNLVILLNFFAPCKNEGYRILESAKQGSMVEYTKFVNQFATRENLFLINFCKYILSLSSRFNRYELGNMSPFKILDLFKAIMLCL